MILTGSNEFKIIKDSIPLGVNLLAVSKGHKHDSIRKLSGYGQLDFGESRLQEAILKKIDLSDLTQLRWHFVGTLQKNKVRRVIKEFDFIHSVDSLPLLERISRISLEEQKTPNIFLQIKFRDDPNKGGFLKQDLLKSWTKIISKISQACDLVFTLSITTAGCRILARPPAEIFWPSCSRRSRRSRQALAKWMA